MRTEVRERVLVVVVSFLALAGYYARTDRLTVLHPYFAKAWDHHKYIEMATHPFALHIAPFCWRILVPLLAWLLPFGLQRNFTILAFCALFLTAIVFYFVLRQWGFSHRVALMGILFFLALGWATRLNTFDFWQTDAAGFLFTVIALWGIFAGRDLVFLAALVVGVTARESVIFVAPLYYTFHARRVFDKRVLGRTLALVSLPVLVLVLIRIAIPPWNGNPAYMATLPETLREDPYNLVTLFRNIGLPRLQGVSYGMFIDDICVTFGVSLVFLPLFAKKNRFLFVKFAPFLVLCLAPLLLAVNTNRLVVNAFPAVIILALEGILAIAEVTGTSPDLFLPLPLLLLVMLLVKPGWFVVPSLLEAFILLAYLAFVFQRRQTNLAARSGGDITPD